MFERCQEFQKNITTITSIFRAVEWDYLEPCSYVIWHHGACNTRNSPILWTFIKFITNNLVRTFPQSGGTLALHRLAMSFTAQETLKMITKFEAVDVVKWLATVIQLIGYAMTGLNFVPYNIYMFFIGIFLWFAVGFMWKDKAIMVVHIGAFVSLLAGYLYAWQSVKLRDRLYDRELQRLTSDRE